MSLLVPPRRPTRELLDDGSLSSEEMVRNLRDIALVNRCWGSSRALADHLLAHIKETGDLSVSVLDVGAGSGDVTSGLARALRKEGFRATVFALDIQWRHLAAGQRLQPGEDLPAVAADAFRLPLPARSIDWIVSTLFLHHFSPAQMVLLLREIRRVARQGFALLDLRRHRLPLLFLSVAGRLAFESRVSLHDGMASIRQAYTPEEASAIAREATADTRVERVFPFRLLLCGTAG